MAAIGRMVTDAVDAKKRVTLLKSNLEAMAKDLQSAAGHINGVIQSIGYPEPNLREVMQKMPSAEKILAACVEFDAELKRAEELKVRVTGLGI